MIIDCAYQQSYIHCFVGLAAAGSVEGFMIRETYLFVNAEPCNQQTHNVTYHHDVIAKSTLLIARC